MHCFCVLGKDDLDDDKKTIKQYVDEAKSPSFHQLMKACNGRYTAVNNKEKDESERRKMREDVLQLVLKMMEENGNAVFTSSILNKVNDAIKINKEGAGRFKATASQVDLDSAGTSAIGIVHIEIIQDKELIPEVQTIVEEQVLHVFNKH